ncbi:MAG: MOSC N-terminal beta barrel domain-containing protein, partial [Bacteroidota bacterium]
MLSVSELCIYPIKGGRGLSVPEAQVERRGLTADRRWMLIDDEGRFLSQRGHPKLALLTVTRTAHGLRVHAPGRSPLDIATPGADAARRPVVIWDDVVDAPLASEAAQAWFSAWLEQSVQLCHMDTKAHRPVDPDYALRPDDSVSFADGYPLLLTSEASLGELNTRIEAGPVPTPVPMDRFRPNVVIAGSEQPFEEDTWLEVQMGDVLFTIVKPCARCVVT